MSVPDAEVLFVRGKAVLHFSLGFFAQTLTSREITINQGGALFLVLAFDRHGQGYHRPEYERQKEEI